MRFNRDWLSKADYKPWLASVEDVTKAYCKMCMKTFSLSNMGEIAVRSHASGKKHQTAVTQSQKASSVSEFFEAKSRTTSGLVSSENLEEPSASLIHDHEVTLQESGSMSTSHGNVMSKFTLTKHQHKAEILWALKTVMSHFSYNSSTNIADVFRAMFPDSAIAQNMNCGPTKLSYLICFGIAPYFKQQLHKDKFSGFKFGEDRLDTFFFEVLDQKIAYKGLWCTVQLLLTLSHGQAAVE